MHKSFLNKFNLVLIVVLLTSPLWGTTEEMLQEANRRYQQGENAASFEERQLAFNQALALYSHVEEKVGYPVYPTLGDTYFQLGEYAWAILYYQRALKIDPDLPLLRAHLESAQQKLSLPSDSFNSSPFIHFFSKILQQSALFFWTFLFTFFICSIAIWFRNVWTRLFATISALCSFLLLSFFLITYYLTPIEGILVASTGFYRAPDETQPQLTTLPLFAGSKVKILQMTSEGNWLKIENATSLIGYIPTANVRLSS